MKKGKPGAPFEDDIFLFLNMESIFDVTLFNCAQFGDAVFHFIMYQRVSRRNSFTVAYQHEEGITYGQIEVFFLIPAVICGAVIAPMSKSGKRVCECHYMLGNPVQHIVSLQHPSKHKFDIVVLENIIDICLYMKFSDSEVGYAARFPNHLERD